MSDEICNDCRYYQPTTATTGHCRHSPPTAGVGFPLVPYNSWCGQFKEK
ncbi:hypothetical protein [Methanolobus sp.]|nr:hypothetical protein [Methanolobus sp.]